MSEYIGSNATIDSVDIISSEHNYSYTLSENKQIVYMTSVMSIDYDVWDDAMEETDTVTYTVNYSNGLSITKTVNARLLTVGEALQLTEDERIYDDEKDWWLADYCHYDGHDYYWYVNSGGVLDYDGNNDDSYSYFARLGFTI